MESLLEIFILGIVAILVILCVVRPLITKAFEKPDLDDFSPEPEINHHAARMETLRADIDFETHYVYIESLRSISKTYGAYLIRNNKK